MIKDDILKVLISGEEITNRCKELGKEISEYYGENKPVLLCLLKGSVPFSCELGKFIEIPFYYDYMKVSSYAGTETTGKVKIVSVPTTDMKGKHILIVEDIIDTGITMAETIKLLETYEPASIEIVTLLNKESRRQNYTIHPKWIGFEVPDEFVVGYGLDYNEDYRQLPYVGVLKPEVYSK